MYLTYRYCFEYSALTLYWSKSVISTYVGNIASENIYTHGERTDMAMMFGDRVVISEEN